MSKVQQINLQDTFLNQVRKEAVQVTIYLVSGVQLRGTVRAFDSFTVLLESPGKPSQLVYKHAVASVVPAVPIRTINPSDSGEVSADVIDLIEEPVEENVDQE